MDDEAEPMECEAEAHAPAPPYELETAGQMRLFNETPTAPAPAGKDF